MPARLTELKALSPSLSAGILSANLMNLGHAIERLSACGIKLLHFDVMDGHFTPMDSVGSSFVRGIQTHLLKDVHLMIQDPLEKVEDYAKAGSDIITVQLESCKNVGPTLKKLATLKNPNNGQSIIRGLSILPDTPVDLIKPYVGEAQLIMLLAVDPTRREMPVLCPQDVTAKFEQLRKLLREVNSDPLLCVDGGVKRANIEFFASLRADIVVSGSAVFEQNNIEENVGFMLGALRESFCEHR